MDNLTEIILAVLGSTSIVSVIVTTYIKNQMDKQQKAQEKRERLRDENQFLMMERVDNCAEMTHLTAQKLHDAGIINGDLEELDKKNKKLNERYNENLKNLAMEVLNK